MSGTPGDERAVAVPASVGEGLRRCADARVRLIGWRPEVRDGLLGVLGRFPQYAVDDQSDQPGARPTAFNVPGAPALAFVDDYRFLPVHTVHDTIDLMHPEALALATEVMAAVTAHLTSAAPPAVAP